MQKVRYLFIALSMLFSSAVSAGVQVGIGIGLPHVSIGINFPVYPDLVVVPGYPVYYAPRQQANLFFYDGLYWVYQDDYWYTSSWYNGPWWIVEPEFVPVFILRVPVRYYRHPPAYFAGWRYDAAPRWGEHWGHNWNQRRSGWDRWDRRSAPQPAPPPTYQRKYSGERYPQQIEQQHELHQNNYSYQPRDPVVKQHYQEQAVPRKPSQQERMREEQGNRAQDNHRPGDYDRGNVRTPRSEDQQRRDTDAQRSAPASPQQGRPEVQDQRQQQPGAEQRRQQGTSMPARQDADSENKARTRTQLPQDGGVSVQRPDRSTSQQGRPEHQDRQQQPRQDQQRSQQPHGKNSVDETGRRQEQERGSSRYD
ncbi:MAG TPA: hypothetical protein VIO87_03805 [Methylotenera sp.]